jgi:hypothetical protein
MASTEVIRHSLFDKVDTRWTEWQTPKEKRQHGKYYVVCPVSHALERGYVPQTFILTSGEVTAAKENGAVVKPTLPRLVYDGVRKVLGMS